MITSTIKSEMTLVTENCKNNKKQLNEKWN